MYSVCFLPCEATHPYVVFHSRDLDACFRFAKRLYDYRSIHPRFARVFFVGCYFVCNSDDDVIFTSGF